MRMDAVDTLSPDRRRAEVVRLLARGLIGHVRRTAREGTPAAPDSCPQSDLGLEVLPESRLHGANARAVNAAEIQETRP